MSPKKPSPTPLTTDASSLASTITDFASLLVNYGCVIFDVAGDDYFNIENGSNKPMSECVAECLNNNPKFKFFITSFFEL